MRIYVPLLLVIVLAAAAPAQTDHKKSHRFTMSQVAGKWHAEPVFSSHVPQSERPEITKSVEATSIVLRKDGSYEMGDALNKIDGTWVISGDQVILTRKTINGKSIADYMKVLEGDQATKELEHMRKSSTGRFQISADGTKLLSPTKNKDVVVMLVRK
jgi:hypothetical protein